MKTLLVCMYYEYGNPDRGLSYEYMTYYEPLKNVSDEVLFYDFMEEFKKYGKKEMNAKLYSMVEKEKPDIVLFALYKDEFEIDTLEKIRGISKTFCFFQDDTWRIDFTQYWGQYFDYFGTPDPFGVEKYTALNINNALPVAFGSNEFINKRLEIDKKYDVTFIGREGPFRSWFVKKLKKAGIDIHAFGHKWPGGRLDYDEMVKIVNQSRINLNISNSRSYDIRYLFSSPRALHYHMKSKKILEQQKARPFEVCGSGGLLMTYYVEGLEKYYDIGKEILVYSGVDNLIDMIKFYLDRPDLMQQIADAGYKRTMSEHTFTHRMKFIIDTVLGNK